ncbi:alpha/beta fold hydrolase [Phaeobacter gallaeciensis]|uniref:Alpha/beta hydrolase family protein n=1 Tax=Phaeobacter gallaeciensis TaxID=60890 RepID=A0AAD0ED87_9RHOB|nr:alpha/beta fold hydrolase [Phaeobacter gallaeciensis]AHD09787.1 Alpha/beta hydrolase family [Phaeobacter gallaeciensis DSM 26640]ATE93051.1 Alpha/beta hydrolase family protein [Phaeobacter gallaeciensis]ATE97127.1 Alpha/beta hydrolase family protein [Phaeobacter gallaeciensis]ATF01716.1 Alpha/beta hydrolase family protein [Phaeobacter gallaeciensis]ATF06096.1 Alpha/beta hydrolase family protein [Phaeobacter gallaeciensis]
MLYELALPGLLLQGGYRWLRSARRATPQEPVLRLRAARGRMRRLEIALLDRLSPGLAARLLLRRFHRNQAETPQPVSRAHEPFADQSDQSHRSHRLAGLYLRQIGPSQGPRVLLLHGWNADGRMMMPLAQELAKQGFCVEVPDLPGTGHSRVAGLASVRSFVGVASRLCRAMSRGKPYDLMIGHSAGGLIAMIALGLGLQAERLVTISSPSSLGRLMTLYLRFTDQPTRTATALMRRYEATCGRSLIDIGPAECRSANVPMLVIHAQHDWQVPASEAPLICAAQEGLTPQYLRNCNHRTVLRHSDLIGLLQRFFDQTSDREVGNAAHR